jgi:hypothetical protein
MRPSTILSIALTIALAGCAGDMPTASVAPSHADRLIAGTARPWTGGCDVNAQITGPTTFLIAGTCEVAHLGRTSVVTQETIDWATGAFTNTSTYTAANGDRLYTTGSGVALFGADGTGAATGTWTAVGGTGRFADASGSAAYAESLRITGPASAAGSYTLDGLLSY